MLKQTPPECSFLVDFRAVSLLRFFSVKINGDNKLSRSDPRNQTFSENRTSASDVQRSNKKEGEQDTSRTSAFEGLEIIRR